jgi:oligoendopeptidase F
LWHKQLHLFLHPFYYIEYGIAQLGALQVWVGSRENPGKALEDYRRALALGGSRPLPELFTAAGCRFDLGLSTVRPLLEEVERELARLGHD